VSPEPLAHIVDVVLGDSNVHTQVYRRLNFIFERFTLQLAHGSLEHLRVQIETDGVYVAGLLPSKQIARAPELQIESGNAKTCAEVRELTDRCEPPASNIG